MCSCWGSLKNYSCAANILTCVGGLIWWTVQVPNITAQLFMWAPAGWGCGPLRYSMGLGLKWGNGMVPFWFQYYVPQMGTQFPKYLGTKRESKCTKWAWTTKGLGLGLGYISPIWEITLAELKIQVDPIQGPHGQIQVPLAWNWQENPHPTHFPTRFHICALTRTCCGNAGWRRCQCWPDDWRQRLLNWRTWLLKGVGPSRPSGSSADVLWLALDLENLQAEMNRTASGCSASSPNLSGPTQNPL